jgi:hypothetical protein
MEASQTHASPILNLDEAAQYLKRTKGALHKLRHRGRGPVSFLIEGRINYYKADIDRYLAEQAAADPHFSGQDPADKPVEPRITRPRTSRPRRAKADA